MIRKLTRDLRSASEPYLRVEREGTPVMSNPPAGWYPDPDNGTLLQYWDGSKWTPYHAPAQPDGRYPDPENGTPRRHWDGNKSESVGATRVRSARTKTFPAEPPPADRQTVEGGAVERFLAVVGRENKAGRC